jgi:hypothetical protein
MVTTRFWASFLVLNYFARPTYAARNDIPLTHRDTYQPSSIVVGTLAKGHDRSNLFSWRNSLLVSGPSTQPAQADMRDQNKQRRTRQFLFHRRCRPWWHCCKWITHVDNLIIWNTGAVSETRWQEGKTPRDGDSLIHAVETCYNTLFEYLWHIPHIVTLLTIDLQLSKREFPT